jgi:hypothetical protein
MTPIVVRELATVVGGAGGNRGSCGDRVAGGIGIGFGGGALMSATFLRKSSWLLKGAITATYTLTGATLGLSSDSCR